MSRRTRGLLASLVVSAVVGAWLFQQWRSRPTQPRWTVDGLPTPPPASENGWLRVAAWGDPSTPHELPDVLEEPGLPDRLYEQELAAGLGGWSAPLERWLDDPHIAEHVRIATVAARMPRYGEACTDPRDVATCANPALPAARKALALAALARASRGELDAALDIASSAAWALLDFVRSARTLVGFRDGVDQALQGLLLVDRLLDLRREHGRGMRGEPASWPRLRRALRTFDQDPPRLTRYVVLAYLWERAELEDAAIWCTDVHGLSESIDGYYEAVHRYADDPRVDAPAPLRNPSGIDAWMGCKPPGGATSLDFVPNLDRQRLALDELKALAASLARQLDD